MITILIVGIIVFLVFIGIAIFIPKEDEMPQIKQKQHVKDEPVLTGLSDRDPGVNDFYISGLSHHCTARDRGIISGAIVNEKDNPVDRKAMALVVGKPIRIIGYVPSAILPDFRRWAGKSDIRFVGYIFVEDGILRGRARAYQRDSIGDERMFEDVEKYVSIVTERYGWPLPKNVIL